MKRYNVYKGDCLVLSKCFAVSEFDACRKGAKNYKDSLGLVVKPSDLRAVLV